MIPTEAVPATIDSWARGMVPSETLSSLDQPISSLEPVQVITTPPSTAGGEDSVAAMESIPCQSGLRPDTGDSERLSPLPALKVYSVYTI